MFYILSGDSSSSWADQQEINDYLWALGGGGETFDIVSPTVQKVGGMPPSPMINAPGYQQNQHNLWYFYQFFFFSLQKHQFLVSLKLMISTSRCGYVLGLFSLQLACQKIKPAGYTLQASLLVDLYLVDMAGSMQYASITVVAAKGTVERNMDTGNRQLLSVLILLNIQTQQHKN